jgi:O-antigen ligase
MFAPIVVLFAYVVFGGGSPTMDEIYENSQAGKGFDYQYLGDAAAVAFLVLLTRIRSLPAVITIACVGAVTLLLIPSRSSAVFGTVAIFCGLLLRLPPNLAILAGSVGLAGGGLVQLSAVQNLFVGTRMESIVFREFDSSHQARQDILYEGLDQILMNPLMGTYLFQVRWWGDKGMYVHNILDVWVQAGLVPFAMFCLALMFLVRHIVILHSHSPSQAQTLLPLLLFICLSWTFSRNLFNIPNFFVFGFMLSFRPRRLSVSLPELSGASSSRAASREPAPAS